MAAVDPVIRPLQHSSEEYAALIDTNSPRLLEVRTGIGAIYVCPSGWERIRLEWVFRHFHVLPPELLSRGDRLIIERLTHSAAIATGEPVARSAVFGVVEQAFPKAGKGPVPLGASRLPVSASAHPPGRQQAREGILAVRELANWMIHRPARRRAQQWKGLAMLGVACLTIILVKNRDRHPARARHSASWSMIAPPAQPSPVLTRSASLHDVVDRGDAAAATEHVTLPLAAPATRQEEPAGPVATGSRRSLLPSAESGDSGAARDTGGRAQQSQPSIPFSSHAALKALPPISAIPPTRSVAAAELILSSSTSAPAGAASGLQPAKAIASPAPASPDVPLEDGAPAALASVSAPQPATVRPFVSELPQSGFAAPALSQPNFVGTVKLHVVIGTDGSVKDVNVLSGDPTAAKAAIAAVKTWRYSPHEVDGQAVEAETMVGISFFGRDAVSVRPLR